MQDVFQELYNVILDRRENPQEGSYTCYLFEKGTDKILKKVAEESGAVSYTHLTLPTNSRV